MGLKDSLTLFYFGKQFRKVQEYRPAIECFRVALENTNEINLENQAFQIDQAEFNGSELEHDANLIEELTGMMDECLELSSKQTLDIGKEQYLNVELNIFH